MPLQYRAVSFDSPLQLLREDPLAFVLVALAIIGAIALHEFAHAYAADLQGDRMPRAMGRVSLDPRRHLDPMGTIAIFLIGFGWGKPVEFRPQALSSKRFGAAIVALAGPVTNLLLAILAALALHPLLDAHSTTLTDALLRFVLMFFQINILLAVFNLIPLPPLDGSRLLTIFLPPSKQNILFFLDRYGFFILLALLFLTGFAFLGGIYDAVGGWVLDLVGIT